MKHAESDESTEDGLRSLAPADDVSALVERIVTSESFRNSDSLRRLLSFLAERYQQAPNSPVSESELAVSVFNRGAEFDSRTDSVVRVHTGRLRARLAEYFMADGELEPLLLEIPKGRYCLVGRPRTVNAPVLRALSHSGTVQRLQQNSKAGLRLLLAVNVVLVAAVFLLVRQQATLKAPPSEQRTMPALSSLWRSFTQTASPTLVVFSNPRFVGSAFSGLRLYRPGIDDGADVNDYYTGSGEALSVGYLASVLSSLGGKVEVKKAQSLSWEQVAGRSLVFLGSPVQNTAVREIGIQGFRFDLNDKGNRIVNEKPRQGEPVEFTTEGPPYVLDHAIVSYDEAPNRGFPAIVLAGTTTYGTQAAAAAVTTEKGAADLLNKVGVTKGKPVPRFVAVLRVRIIRGAVVESSPVLVRSQAD